MEINGVEVNFNEKKFSANEIYKSIAKYNKDTVHKEAIKIIKSNRKLPIWGTRKHMDNDGNLDEEARERLLKNFKKEAFEEK